MAEWYCQGKTEGLEKNLSQCYFVYHKSNTGWFGETWASAVTGQWLNCLSHDTPHIHCLYIWHTARDILEVTKLHDSAHHKDTSCKCHIMSCFTVLHLWLNWNLTLIISSEMSEISSEVLRSATNGQFLDKPSNYQMFKTLTSFNLFFSGEGMNEHIFSPHHLPAATTPLHLFPLPPTICLQLQLLSTYSSHSQQLSTVLPFVLQQALSARYCNQLTPSGQYGWYRAVGYQLSALLPVFILSQVWIHRLIILYDQQNITSCQLTYDISHNCSAHMYNGIAVRSDKQFWSDKILTLQLSKINHFTINCRPCNISHCQDPETKGHCFTWQLKLLINSVFCDGRWHSAHCYSNLLLSGVHKFYFKVEQLILYSTPHM